MKSDAIICRNISKSYGENQVLSDLSFSMEYGGVYRIIGASGCGKTTLLRLICGLEKPDSGTLTGAKREDISYLFQEDRLLPWFSALKNVEIASTDKNRRELAEKLLSELGLDKEKDFRLLPSELSGGMSRRVAIARALIRPSRILILDEALRGLDDENRARCAEVIGRYSQKKTVIFVTHGEATEYNGIFEGYKEISPVS